MTKNQRLLASVAIIAVAIVGTSLATSNSAFKLRVALRATDGGVTSASGRQLLALPFHLEPGMTTAKDLMDDIGFASVSSISKYLAATDTMQTYTGRKASPGANFVLTPGEGYVVRMATTLDYEIVGCHDDTIGITLRAPDGGVTSRSGRNLFSPPFNSTAGTAKDLMDDIGFASVGDVSRFVAATDTLQTYTGRKASPGANFPILRGEAYYIRMNTTVNYTPSHY